MFKKLIIYVVLPLLCILLLESCGRRGALEPHPSTQINTEDGTMQEKPQEDKSFVLDKLI